ncbi:hypothetical protein AVEN_144470-1 [Araneus ventricosus]|uniref:Uncharacterized protein n=1 Tax=Araneus ventricosus TaxID=182803 RepID=A0A4Y2WXB4_ARAVE|nr:hypothetical protein AVEN_144470-1 [Araneus ventricosus]
MFIDNPSEDQEHQRDSPPKKEYWKVIAKHPKKAAIQRIREIGVSKSSVSNQWESYIPTMVHALNEGDTTEENIFVNGTGKNVNRMHSLRKTSFKAMKLCSN